VARLAPHSTWQAPIAHTRPAAQVLPHAPQFARSVVSVTHAPPHSRWLAGQLT
jgi:hypothetical protein